MAKLGLGFISSIAILPSLAYAQDATDASSSEDIVVTANKREQRLQDVGIAVTSLGETALSSLGRQEITSLAKLVPSVQIQPLASPALTVINIRGVSQNDFSDLQEAPVAFYSDGVYISSLAAISGMTYDLKRIEILRGPQGTLFGRNATGGLVQIISAPPTKHTDGFLTVSLDEYKGLTTEGAIGGPISEALRGRLSFTTANGGAFFKNRNGPDIGSQNFYALRGQLEADVSDTGTLRLKVQHMRNKNERSAGNFSWRAAAPNALGQGEFVGDNELATFISPLTGERYTTCPGCDGLGYKEPDDNPFTGTLGVKNIFDRTYWSGSATYEQDLGGVQFASVTDYQNLRKVFATQDGTGPIEAASNDTRVRFWQASQEFRLSGSSERLQWTAGVFGLKMRTRVNSALDFALANSIFSVIQSVDTTAAAAFGQVEYKVAEPVSVIAGLRYNWERKSTDITNFVDGVAAFTLSPQSNPSLARLSTAEQKSAIRRRKTRPSCYMPGGVA